MSEVVKFGESDSAILVAGIAEAGPTTIAYNGDGTLNYIEVKHNGAVYRQTYSYDAGKMTGISAWVKP